MSKNSIVSEVQSVTGMNEHLLKRLTLTLGTLASQSDNPSISDIAKNDSERVAISRFFNNENVDADAILASHARMTEERATSHNVVLFVQDTTEISLPESVSGIGPTSSSTSYGYYIHPVLATTSDGLPLGCYAHKIWTRSIDRVRGRKRENMLRSIPAEEKESIRWLEGYQATSEFAQRHPDIISVCIGDSESDMYDLYAMERPIPNLHFLIRACYDRVCIEKDSKEVMKLKDKFAISSYMYTDKIKVQKRTTKLDGKRHEFREDRDAEVEVRSCEVCFKRPSYNKLSTQNVSMNVVFVKEINPPEGETPVEWTLLTTLPACTAEEAKNVVSYYKTRWQIELFFRTLKEGCAIEKRQHGSFKSAKTCASLLMIIAWHIMAITYTPRQHPEVSSELFFEPDEQKALYAFVDNAAEFPEEPPTIGEFIIKLAKLGGYSPTSKYPPGVRTIWKAVNKLMIITACWKQFTAMNNMFNPEKG